MKNKELEAYYNTYRDLFVTDGWKQLVTDLLQNANVINSVESTKDNEDLYFRKGQLAILAHVINLEAQIQAAEEQIEEQENQKDSEE
tara:strand:+ start:1509 stop:1769 length:261 start_codon:yes stop_codon:yes gene_type:complete